MQMTEFGSLQLPDQVNLPFAISCTSERYVIATKAGVEILQLKYKHINEDGALNYILTRFECSKEKPTGQLATKEIEVYNSSSRSERAKILLDQTIIPNVATLYINNMMAVASPPGIFQDYSSCLVAHLTNMGQLTLQRYDESLNEWILYVDVSSSWIAHVYDNSVFRRFDKLEPAVQDSLITAFCWRDQAIRHVTHFVIGTKSAKIAIYSLLSDSVRVEFTATASSPVRILKWITISEDRNLLLAGLQSGEIALYSFRTLPDATVVDFVAQSDVWNDADNLTVGHIEYEIDQANGRLLALAVKGTHLLAFVCSLHGEVISVAIQNMNNFMITGLQQLSSFCYVVCTLPGLLYCVNLKTINASQLVIEHIPIQTDLNLSKFSIYGVTATKNRACWLFIGYPSKSFDRLSLRTPTVVFFCKFSERDPLKILLSNPSLRMTDYYDCAEVIRYCGNRVIATLSELETLATTQANLDDGYSYLLKLQLIQLGAKLSHYKKRCISMAEVLSNQSQFLILSVDILHAAKVIYYLIHVRQTYGQLSYPQLLTVRCLRNFIKEYVEDSFPGDWEHIHVALKPTMSEVIDRANEMLTTATQQPYNEECSFCGEVIPDLKQTCQENHQTFRCTVTRQQIAIRNVETVCDMCGRYSQDVELLAEIFCMDGGSLSIYYRYCNLCDVPFIKRFVV